MAMLFRDHCLVQSVRSVGFAIRLFPGSGGVLCLRVLIDETWWSARFRLCCAAKRCHGRTARYANSVLLLFKLSSWGNQVFHRIHSSYEMSLGLQKSKKCRSV